MKFFSHNLVFTWLVVCAGLLAGVQPSARGAVLTVTSVADSGPGSLRDTIAVAGSGDTIVFSSSISGQTIHLTSGELFVTNGIAIDASALPARIAIDGGASFRVFEIASTNVTMNALIVTNGYVGNDTGAGVEIDDTNCSLVASNCNFCGNSSGEYGGGIENDGTLTLENSTVSGNTANELGGGILSYGGVMTLNSCTVCGNLVTNGEGGDGGGIESELSVSTINNCVVSNNFSSLGGGMNSEFYGTLLISNCIFAGNFSTAGGGLFAEVPATVSNCTFSKNISTNTVGGFADGGGIDNEVAMTLDNCIFCSNSAPGGFGGALETFGTLTMSNCTFFGNSATSGALGAHGVLTANNCTFFGNTVSGESDGGGLTCSGGGIYSFLGLLTLNNCTLSDNSASGGYGGGLCYESSTNVLINCAVCGNAAASGGGLQDMGGSILILSNSIVAGNIATNGGGLGISIFGTNFIEATTAYNCTFSANSATNGGAIYCDQAGGVTLENCTLYGNSALSGNGGAICDEFDIFGFGEPPTNALINCTVCGNSASGGFGGGLYNSGYGVIALTNTIVSSNTVDGLNSDVYVVYTIFNYYSYPYVGMNNFIDGNPQLAPLGNYGGPAETMPPEFGSPVIDAGTDSVTNFLATDQRGFPRLAGAHVDIGAVEAQIAPANNRPVLRNAVLASIGSGSPGVGVFRFSFANAPDADFTVLTSTNLQTPLAQWTVLGNVPQVSPLGFYDTGTNIAVTIAPQQFFRVVSP